MSSFGVRMCDCSKCFLFVCFFGVGWGGGVIALNECFGVRINGWV